MKTDIAVIIAMIASITSAAKSGGNCKSSKDCIGDAEYPTCVTIELSNN